MSNENPNRRRVDFFISIVQSYRGVQLELQNPMIEMTPERKGWLLDRAATLAAQIDTTAEQYLSELISGTGILRSGHTAH